MTLFVSTFSTLRAIINPLVIAAAIVATMLVTYLCLAYVQTLLARIGLTGIDSATRLIGFFVAAMGGGLIFHGVMEALQTYGVVPAH